MQLIAIARRDFTAYLNSFSFYVLTAFFLGVTGYFFWSGLSYFSLISFQVATNPEAQVKGLNLTEGVLSPFLSNMTVLMLLLIPILTMRAFSEEKRLGTLELLFSYPISDLQIVIGKFLSLLGLFAVFVFPTISYFYLGGVVSAQFETPTLLSGYGGLFVVGASFISLSMFISSLTEHQAVSAGIGFVILLFFWILGWMAEWVSPALGTILRELSLVEHFYDLSRGVLDTKDIAFFVLFILFFLFASLCSLEVRTWKR
ncbi:MAG: hypothetical protein A3G87_09740 [Omnitrophica bacterium RIFCSPLOWO2_12_FULL_50_11]|nr:MAG: hypothetical protein A3G87_09740 [Omnitrophica bacterium RIFCSPLOWO2_12_FULL_50_11]